MEIQYIFFYFCEFSQHKNIKIHAAPVLPPGGINWQLIFPHKGAFTLANFACDFTLSLHVLLQKIFFSLLNVQA
jgi:hypothetical protein